MHAGSYLVGWVDLLVVILLVVGVLRGRKRGMSEELLDVIKWSLIVLVAGMLYEPSGRWLSQMSVFSLLSSYVFAYVAIAVLIFATFALIRSRIGEKLIGSDVFGRSEYYLGMVAGGYRYVCVMLVAMAFLNARYYTPAEISASNKYQDWNFGTTLFPTIPDFQREVFDNSLTGRAAHDYLNVILIRPTARDDKGVGGDGSIRRQRERTINEIMDKR
jgi:uncharacterized membrane protein required for colicin V production